MADKLYRGSRDGNDRLVVTVENDGLDDARELAPRLYLWNHSSTGFECGYAGSGPAQLALAIVAEHKGDDALALDFHQRFKFLVVANLPREGWCLTSRQIEEALSQL